MFKKYLNLNKLSTLLFYFSILIFIIAFNFAHNPPSGWYQQFMPELNGQILSDVIFLDSLNGFAITDNDLLYDTGYIAKTTNGGDNWNIIYSDNRDFKAIQFINLNTGYVCAGDPFTSSNLLKSTDSGVSWFDIHPPDPALVLNGISVYNEDTIWLAASSSPTGGVFRTTNGGVSWQRQFSGNPNPDKIYMFNKDIGFISAGSNLLKTTNSGLSWTGIPGAGNFLDMYFIDSLTGWLSRGNIYKSTNGGFNWLLQIIPTGGYILTSAILNFQNVNTDTIWGVGGSVFYGAGQGRGIVYRTTNGGENWLYQIPDTAIHIGAYFFTNFINNSTGWCYYDEIGGIHTKTGGDSIFTIIKELSNIILNNFILKQNYPNPFNPKTNINYELSQRDRRISNYITLKVYDILGNEIMTLVNKKQQAGKYEVNFDGSGLPSGVYFYSLFIDEVRVDTKKMVLVR